MEELQKDKIVEAVNNYMAMHGIKPAEFARKADVNESYFNSVYRGKYIYQNTIIKDIFFVKIAKACGYEIEPAYWQHVNTDQYSEIVYKLDEAHKRQYLNTIIGGTGFGKSYSVERYKQIHFDDAIVVTINGTDDVYSILTVLAEGLKVELPNKRSLRLRKIASELKKSHDSGRKLLLIFDEIENIKIPGIKALKAIYDLGVQPKYCGMALVGTQDFINKLNKYVERTGGLDGATQFKRRAIAGVTHLEDIERTNEFEKFMETAGVMDASLKQLLLRHCDNYGVLHDYLERAVRIADEEGVALTKELFCEIYNITY